MVKLLERLTKAKPISFNNFGSKCYINGFKGLIKESKYDYSTDKGLSNRLNKIIANNSNNKWQKSDIKLGNNNGSRMKLGYRNPITKEEKKNVELENKEIGEMFSFKLPEKKIIEVTKVVDKAEEVKVVERVEEVKEPLKVLEEIELDAVKELEKVKKIRKSFVSKEPIKKVLVEPLKVKKINKIGNKDIIEKDNDEGVEKKYKKKPKKVFKKEKEILVRDVYLPPFIKVAHLAKLLGVNYSKMRIVMQQSGLPDHPHDYLLSGEDASLIALAFNLNPIEDQVQSKDLYPQTAIDGIHPNRPPVVTIMGHVDHGKTTLLDALRSTSVAAGEAGGITQHIGAFEVKMTSGKSITFLDTPGHAAFRNMRQRGANVTDIVVLVIAADDGIMPQTKEAIEHSLEAQVPMVVAFTKCDKPTKNLKKIKEELLQYNVQLEEFGGDCPCVEVAATTGKGLPELEETILTLAEVLDLTSPIKGSTEATVLESNVDKGLGPVTTIVVNKGTLKLGQILVAGTAWCKVKSITDHKNKRLKQALPGMPVRISGWKQIPNAGDVALQAKDENEAKLVVDNRTLRDKQKLEFIDAKAINDKRAKDYELTRRVELNPENEESIREKSELDNGIPILPIIVKGDVSGTVEAISESILSFPSTKVKPVIIHSGVGSITKADLDTAQASSGIIVTFNVKPEKEILNQANLNSIKIYYSNIIYNLLEDVQKQLLNLLPQDYKLKEESILDILKIFEMKLKNRSGVTKIAGCKVSQGTLDKSHIIKVIRPKNKSIDDGLIVKEDGEVTILKVFKQDVTSVKKGMECTLELKWFDQYQEGDKLISYSKVEIPKFL